ncbi:MAG: hypothetical protein AAGA08_16860 [Pseudomonadota bacterium]
MTKRRSRTTTEQTVTPTNPGFVTGPVSGVANQVGALSQRDPLEFVTGASSLQKAAFDAAGGLGKTTGTGQNYLTRPGQSTGLFDQAADLTSYISTRKPSFADSPELFGDPVQAQSASLLDNLDSYISPYTDQVVDTTLAEYDEQSGRNRRRLAASLATDDAFGGSRAAVREGIFEGETDRLRALTEAGLRDTAFNTGAQLSNLDADRRQQTGLFNAAQEQQARLSDQDVINEFSLFNEGMRENALNRALSAAGKLTDIGQVAGSEDRANTGLMAALGDVQRQIERDSNTADLELLRAQTSLLGGLPLGLFQGQNATGTSETTQRGGGLFSGLFGAAARTIGEGAGRAFNDKFF